MENIKAIETYYNGYRFRSRLEARWAIFLDKIGIKWIYESEGYKTEDGIYYLPDFYLPEYRCLLEIKRADLYDPLNPDKFFSKHKDGIKLTDFSDIFVEEDNEREFDFILVAFGDPIEAVTKCKLVFVGTCALVTWEEPENTENLKFSYQYPSKIIAHIPVNPLHFVGKVEDKNDTDIFLLVPISPQPNTENSNSEIIPIGRFCTTVTSLKKKMFINGLKGEKFVRFEPEWMPFNDPTVIEAFEKARQARFEHGEKP